MTGADSSDEEPSKSGSDRTGRFGDIASEFSDEFDVWSEDGPDSDRQSGSPDTNVDVGDGTRGADADDWEWVGDSESEIETDRNSADSRASDIPERSNKGGRLWNDGPIDSELEKGGPTDSEPIGGGPTDSEPIGGGPTDSEPIGGGPTDSEPTGDRLLDDESVRDSTTESDESAWRSVTDNEPAGDSPTGGDTERTAANAAGSEPDPNPNRSADPTSHRVWNESAGMKKPSATTETTRSLSSGDVSTESSTTDTPGTPDASGLTEDESALDGDRFDHGTNVLIQSESRAERTRDGCHQLLFGRGNDRNPYVLLVRYQPIDGERLEGIASKGHRTHVISVGYAQSVPPAADGTVEVTQINNPNDITRLGIIVSRITQEWSTDDREIRVCYDSLNVLLNYRDVKN
ncbi:hypothetical protein EXE43_18705, partial [Halorubrum sp. SS5]